MIHTLAIIGFPPHEQHLLGIFLKMTIRREHSYQVVTNPTDSQVLLVDADSAGGMKWIEETAAPHQKVLLVGKPKANFGWPVIHRPYAMVKLVEQLDHFFLGTGANLHPAGAETELTAKAPLVPSQIVKPAATPTAPRYGNTVRQGTGATPIADRPTSSRSISSFLGLSDEVNMPQKSDNYDEILVVDDSDIALKFMQKLLPRFGFRAELVKTGEDALARSSAKSYKFIFIDVMMDGMDGYQTCRAIRQRKSVGIKPPVIVMLTSRGASLDKMRGSLAGCDAYLTKPLEERALLQTLSKYDEQVQRGFQETTDDVSGIRKM